MNLKPVKPLDINLIYEWANEKVVRENAFNQNQISYDEHETWFYGKLSSDNVLFYIFYIDETPIGQIRVDIENRKGMIDYSIDSRHRGKGYGTLILEHLIKETELKEKKVKLLIGDVKLGNMSSRKAFEKAGFKGTAMEDIIRYSRNI